MGVKDPPPKKKNSAQRCKNNFPIQIFLYVVYSMFINVCVQNLEAGRYLELAQVCIAVQNAPER